MAERLEGKRALVTAAGQGIGQATAKAFAEHGAEVHATDVKLDLLEALAALDRVSVHHLDVTDANEITSRVAEIGQVDVLFNCAGYVHHGSILDCEEADWDFSFNLNGGMTL